MQRVLSWFLGIYLAVSACSADANPRGIEIWDGLPALEPLHLRGLWAGRHVCPMCAHGYDSGLMVVVQSTVSIDKAKKISSRLAPSNLGITSERFRVFIVFVGRPNSETIDALTVDDPRWFVMQLEGMALDHAERDMRMSLRDGTRGFVFAQRRLFAELGEAELIGGDGREVASQAHYAVRIMNELHPNPEKAMQGGLMYFAPDQLRSEVVADSLSPAREICMRTNSGSLAGALVNVEDHGTNAWARTDAQGCVIARGFAQEAGQLLTVYVNREPTRSATLSKRDFDAGGKRIEVALSERRERVVGLPCENCESVFVGMPAVLASVARIAPLDVSGEPLHVSGRVLDENGRSVAGAVLYAYQTNSKGIYEIDKDVGRLKLRGWVKSDGQGNYAFNTIRPGNYPRRDIPAHIHMHVIEPGRCTYYIDDVRFTDDKLPTIENEKPRGGSGLSTPKKNSAGVWEVTRDVYLGRNVPGYGGCLSAR